MDGDMVEVSHIFGQAVFHSLCHLMPLYYGQPAIDDNVYFHLITAPGSTYFEIMGGVHPVYGQGTVHDPVDDFAPRGGIGEFMQRLF